MIVRRRRTRRGSWVVAGHVRLVRDLASDRRVSARPVWRSEIEIECVGLSARPGRGGVAPPRESRESAEHPTPAPSAAKAQRSAAPAAPPARGELARRRVGVCPSCDRHVCDSRVERGDVFSFIIEFSW